MSFSRTRRIGSTDLLRWDAAGPDGAGIGRVPLGREAPRGEGHRPESDRKRSQAGDWSLRVRHRAPRWRLGPSRPRPPGNSGPDLSPRAHATGLSATSKGSRASNSMFRGFDAGGEWSIQSLDRRHLGRLYSIEPRSPKSSILDQTIVHRLTRYSRFAMLPQGVVGLPIPRPQRRDRLGRRREDATASQHQPAAGRQRIGKDLHPARSRWRSSRRSSKARATCPTGSCAGPRRRGRRWPY